MNSQDYYEQGNAYRRQGNWQKALECYAEAIELNPDSPAVHARDMLNSILGFYSKDALNPCKTTCCALANGFRCRCKQNYCLVGLHNDYKPHAKA